MEHRQAHREQTDILVLVSSADGITRKGCIKDISLEGAGVVMSSGTLTHGSIVDIRLSPTDSKLHGHKTRLRGYVVRTQDSVIGLLWITENAGSTIITKMERRSIDSGSGDALLIA